MGDEFEILDGKLFVLKCNFGYLRFEKLFSVVFLVYIGNWGKILCFDCF